MNRNILKNGMVVEVEDKTVILSGDLYMVHIEFTISITLGEDDGELRRYCNGDHLRKAQVFKKAAVHERDLEQVKKSLKESYFRTTTRYLEHPRFIERFKRRSLDEYREQEEKNLRRVVYEE
jgi:hypothetical protein